MVLQKDEETAPSVGVEGEMQVCGVCVSCASIYDGVGTHKENHDMLR